MINIEILDTSIDKLSDNISIAKAVRNAVYAFTGKPETIVFAFDKSQLILVEGLGYCSVYFMLRC